MAFLWPNCLHAGTHQWIGTQIWQITTINYNISLKSLFSTAELCMAPYELQGYYSDTIADKNPIKCDKVSINAMNLPNLGSLSPSPPWLLSPSHVCSRLHQSPFMPSEFVPFIPRRRSKGMSYLYCWCSSLICLVPNFDLSSLFVMPTSNFHALLAVKSSSVPDGVCAF